MFEKLDEFIDENSDEMLVTGGWGDDKIIGHIDMQEDIKMESEMELI